MKITLDNLGAVGYIADLPAHSLPVEPLAWSGATNVVFRGGMIERVQGYAVGFDSTPTEVSYGLFAATQVNGTPYVIGCADGKVYTYTQSTEYDCTGAVTVAATADTKWTGGQLSGFLVLNESVNAPVYIAVSALGSGSLAALSNWPASTLCKTLRPYKYFLVAANMTESGTNYPFKVRWSNSAVPGALPSTWVAAASNLAGSVDLSADDGPIVDMLDFGDMMAIYRSSGITLMRYSGGSDVMVFNRVPSAAGGGLVGNNCVVDVPGIGHVAMSSSDIYVFNGSAVQSIVDKRLKRWYANQLSSSTAKRAFALHHETNREVWCCFPSEGEAACTQAIIWNYSDNTLGIRDLPNVTSGVHAFIAESATPTWANASGTWADGSTSWLDIDAVSAARKTVLASTANKLYVVGNATDKAGSSLVGQIERTGINVGEPQRVKYFRSIWPRFDGNTGQDIEIQVGASMAVDESVDWQSAKTYTIGSSRKVDVNKSGRFMALRIRSPSGAQWRLPSMDVDFEPRGVW